MKVSVTSPSAMSVDVSPAREEVTFMASNVYRLETCCTLPTIDLLRTPLSKIVGPRSMQHYLFMSLMRRYYMRVGSLYRVGVILAVIAILVPRSVGLALAAPAGIFTLPSLMLMSLTLGIDMMKIAVQQFEFWYFTALNIVTWSLLASMYSDFRVFSLIGGILGTQSTIVMDANFRTVVNTLRSCIVAVPAITLIAVLSFLRMIDTDSCNFRAVHIRSGVEVDIADICANTAATLALFVARKAYCKRKCLSKNARGLRIIRCVVFRARLVLRPCELDNGVPDTNGLISPQGSVRSEAAFRRTFTARSAEAIQQVALVPPRLEFINARQIVAPRIFNSRISPFSVQPNAQTEVGDTLIPSCSFRSIFTLHTLLILNTTMSLILTSCGLFLPTASHAYDAIVAIASLITTLGSCLPILLCAQRDLVGALFSNFDFIFVWVQFTIALLMLCDMTLWDWRSVAALSWLIWFYTVLLFDAVMPPYRKSLRVTKRFAALPILLTVIGMLILVFLLLFMESSSLTDRTILSFKIVQGRVVALQSKNVLLNRLLTLIVWSLRLLWEFAIRAEDELVFIRGSLEYYTPLEMFPPVSETVIAPLSVLPTPIVRRLSRGASFKVIETEAPAPGANQENFQS